MYRKHENYICTTKNCYKRQEINYLKKLEEEKRKSIPA